MATALYRRYRPDTFAEVIGQDHVTVPLTAALTKNRVNHAYLFSGPRGCGKTTSARILARCLNCEKGPTPTPCGVCDSCTDLARGGPGSLDVVEIDAASHGGVDDARSLRERAAYAPARDRYKIFIIDEAHMVSNQGFNALLKIVEEPPEHVRFVFATTEPEKVIGTIRSRTHHYPFRLVAPETLQNYLGELCEAEGVPVGHGVLPLVVRAGAGSVRDSLSVLDQLMAGSGPDGLDYPMAVSLLGYTDASLLDDVIDALAAQDGASTFAVLDRVISTGHDPRRFVEDLLERLRDLIVVAAVPDGSHAILRALPPDQLERMTGQAARFGRSELSRAADIVNTALTEMTGATSPRLQLELLIARLLLPGAEDGERGLRARVDRIEKRMGVATPASDLGGRPAMTGSMPEPVLTSPRAALNTSPPAASPPIHSAPASGASASGHPADGPSLGGPATDHVAPERPAPSESRPEPHQERPSAPAARSAEPAGWEVPVSEPPSSAMPHAAAQSPASATGSGATPRPAGQVDVDQIRRMWPDVLNALSQIKRATWSLVSQHAQVLEYDGQRLVLQFGSAGLAASFARGAHQEFLRQALIDVIGLDCALEAVSGRAENAPTGGSAGRAPAPPQPRETMPPSAVATSTHVAPQSAAPQPTAQPTAPAQPAPPAQPAVPAPASQSAPQDDIPWPDEPPPDDEGAPPDAAPSATVRTQPARSQDRAPVAAGPGSRSSQGSRAEQVAQTNTPPAQAPRVAAAHDEDASLDDADIEGSNQVGRPVVEQLLGGRVIEERDE